MGIKEFKDCFTNLRGDLLEGILGQSSGQWYEIASRDKFSIHCIIGSATFLICGSNEDPGANALPANSDDGADLVAAGMTSLGTSATITASTMVGLKFPVRFIKIKVTAYSSGVIHAYLEGV